MAKRDFNLSMASAKFGVGALALLMTSCVYYVGDCDAKECCPEYVPEEPFC